MQEVGAPRWDEADFRLARQFLLSYDPETRAAIEAEIRRTYGDGPRQCSSVRCPPM